MPKLKLPEIPHASLTNHRIVVSESEPFPDDAFHLVPPEAPYLIHLNETPGQERSPLPLLVQLQVYEDLMGSHPEYQTRYFGIVDKLALSDPNNVLVLEGLARKMRQQGTAEGEQHAIQYLSKAIEQGAVAPINYEWLAGMLAHSGQTSKAIDTIHRGIKVAPTNSLFYRSLGLLYVSMGNYPAALRAISKELELLPQDSSMRNLLKKVDRAAHAPDVTVTPDLPEVGSSVSP